MLAPAPASSGFSPSSGRRVLIYCGKLALVACSIPRSHTLYTVQEAPELEKFTQNVSFLQSSTVKVITMSLTETRRGGVAPHLGCQADSDFHYIIKLELAPRGRPEFRPDK
jgi:hypothetical protein